VHDGRPGVQQLAKGEGLDLSLDQDGCSLDAQGPVVLKEAADVVPLGMVPAPLEGD